MVTGVGAIMGYGLLRSLRATFPHAFLLGTDIYDDAAGRAWSDQFVQAPYTASESYGDWLTRVVETYDIQLIIPGIEQDVHWLSDHRTLLGRCKVALNNARLIKLSQDKWAMFQALDSLNDPAIIPSRISGDFDSLSAEFGLPLIVKPRRGYASKGLMRISSREEFGVVACHVGSELMVQPVIGSDASEYTVAVFGDGRGGVAASISMLRKLGADGATAKAWVRNEPALDETVERLCSHFCPVGPTNLQFRRDVSGEWKLLEINPRISSTSSIRRAFGFDEALMCVEYFLQGKLPVQPPIRGGFAVRYIEDLIVYDRDHF